MSVLRPEKKQEDTVGLVSDVAPASAGSVGAILNDTTRLTKVVLPEGPLGSRLMTLQAFWQKLTVSTLGQMLQRNLSPEDWSALQKNNDQRRYILDFKEAVDDYFSIRFRNEVEFGNGDSVEIQADVGASKQEALVRDFMENTGFNKIASRLIKKIRIETAKHDDSEYGYVDTTDEMHLKVGNNKLSFLARLILHEIGHKMQDFVAKYTKGQEWICRYSVSLALKPLKYSSYAESFRQAANKTDRYAIQTQNQRIYLMESFAEESVLYFLRPDYIPEERRMIFDEIFKELFDSIDIEEIRKAIGLFLGNNLGKRRNDLLQPTDCRTTNQFVERWLEKA